MFDDRSDRAVSDAYIDYTHRFFRKWLPVYDGFAASIFWTYRVAAALAEPAPGRTILDLCTGTGEVALRLARRGAHVIGIDVTPEMLEKARAKALHVHATSTDVDVDFRLGDARHLDLSDQSVDAVTLSFALHDMPRAVRLEVLAEAMRVTRDRLVIVDYHVGPGLLGRAMARAIALFESAYFPRFAREGGVEPLLEQLDLVPASARRIFPCFKAWVIDRDEAPSAQPADGPRHKPPEEVST